VVVSAADMKVKAVLIWGTNDETSPDANHKPASQKLADELGRIFKWKHYFIVNRAEKEIKDSASVKFEMSTKCRVDVKNLGNDSIEVHMFGDGKPIESGKHAFPPAHRLTLAGPVDKNSTAWFVLLQNTTGMTNAPAATAPKK
jgi:hypothetical protein